VAEAVHGSTPVFEGDSIAFLRTVMCGQIGPEPEQMIAVLLWLNLIGQHLRQRAKLTGLSYARRRRRSIPRANAKTAGWEDGRIFGSYTVARKLRQGVAAI
jgi:hypothetical protein